MKKLGPEKKVRIIEDRIIEVRLYTQQDMLYLSKKSGSSIISMTQAHNSQRTQQGINGGPPLFWVKKNVEGIKPAGQTNPDHPLLAQGLDLPLETWWICTRL